MHKITIKIKNIFTKKTNIIKELIQADARLHKMLDNTELPILLKLKHKNMLDILTYIEPLNPYNESSEYKDITLSIHSSSYADFNENAKEKNQTKKNYLESLLNKYYQIDLDPYFHTFKLKNAQKLNFLNTRTTTILIESDYMSTDFLLKMLKAYKNDLKANNTDKLYFKIMQFYIMKLKEDNYLKTKEYENLKEIFKVSKMECEIDVLEKIIFLRHKLKFDKVPSNKRTKVFKNLYTKNNKLFKINSCIDKFIKNELSIYMNEDSHPSADLFAMANFKAFLRLPDAYFRAYTYNLEVLDTLSKDYIDYFDDLSTVDYFINQITKGDIYSTFFTKCHPFTSFPIDTCLHEIQDP